MSNDGKWMTLENPIFNFDKNDNFAKFHFEYTKSNPPSELFHYTNGDSVLKILKSGCIHATESTYLNDPYERVYGENLLVEKINNLSDLKFKNKVLEALKSNSEKGKFLTFIFSLSENPNILSQWREYAYQGKGSIIGFDSSVIFDRAVFPIKFDNVNFYINTSGMTESQPYTLAIKDLLLVYKDFVVSALKPIKSERFAIYPNPVNNKILNIRLSENNSQNVRTEIYNVSGQLLMSTQHGVYKGNSISIAIKDFSSGMYLLKVYENNQSSIAKFVVD